MAILKEADTGIKVASVCRKHGISQPTYYNCKSKYAGMSVSELKRMHADLAMENHALKELLEKSSEAGRSPGGGRLARRRTTVACGARVPPHERQPLGLVSRVPGSR